MKAITIATIALWVICYHFKTITLTEVLIGVILQVLILIYHRLNQMSK